MHYTVTTILLFENLMKHNIRAARIQLRMSRSPCSNSYRHGCSPAGESSDSSGKSPALRTSHAAGAHRPTGASQCCCQLPAAAEWPRHGAGRYKGSGRRSMGRRHHRDRRPPSRALLSRPGGSAGCDYIHGRDHQVGPPGFYML